MMKLGSSAELVFQLIDYNFRVSSIRENQQNDFILGYSWDYDADLVILWWGDETNNAGYCSGVT